MPDCWTDIGRDVAVRHFQRAPCPRHLPSYTHDLREYPYADWSIASDVA